MNRIEAVIFDLGNVLITVDETVALRRVCERTGRTPREVQDYIFATPFDNQLALGQLTGHQFYETVAHDLKFDGDYEKFCRIWAEIFTPIDSMIALAVELKGRVRRIVLSNTNAIHMEYILRTFPFLRELDGLVLSHEVGVMKPDERIYQYTLQKFELRAEATVFLDDILANVEGARRVGMHGIHVHDPEQAQAELAALGVIAPASGAASHQKQNDT